MPRQPTGQVIEPTGGRAWALRFRAYGKRRYLTLGSANDGWTRQRVEAELRHVLAGGRAGHLAAIRADAGPDVRRPALE